MIFCNLRQQQHSNNRMLTRIVKLFLLRFILVWSLSSSSSKVSLAYQQQQQPSIVSNKNIPFLIQRLERPCCDRVFSEVASMCIQAFFNDDSTTNSNTKQQTTTTSPWKALQLAYLRQLQTGDLQRRHSQQSDENSMFVARKVRPALPNEAKTTPLLLDMSEVYNLQYNHQYHQYHSFNQEDYVQGEILGFVEVTLRSYGLGGYASSSTIAGKRPVLTNLSVCAEARNAGVGSQLLYMCEQEVQTRWNLNEIVLEVEDDNVNALEFYKKRGYKLLFEDPTSRRYDLSGMWLKQVRCKRQIMRKTLGPVDNMVSGVSAQVQSSMNNFGIKVLQRLRDNVFAPLQ